MFISLKLKFLEKVASERIGLELIKILSGNQPQQSIRDIQKLQVFPLIYKRLIVNQGISEEIIKKLTDESVIICGIVGELFKEIKNLNTYCGRSVPKEQI